MVATWVQALNRLLLFKAQDDLLFFSLKMVQGIFLFSYGHLCC